MICAALVFSSLVVYAQQPQAPQPPARGVHGFQRILWLAGGPTRDARFFATVKNLGFTAVSVSGEEDPALPGRYGLRFYRDQIVGKGVLELRDAVWKRALAGYAASRDPKALTRPSCLAEPRTLEVLERVLRRKLGPALPFAPLAISIGDEVSTTRHANPLDFCFAPASLRAFRNRLRLRYGDIEHLDRAWGTRFSSIADVLPFTADQIRRREQPRRHLPHNLRPWAEHLAFMDRELARVVGYLARRIASKAPGTPAGLTGMQPPSAYGGHDYSLLMPELSFYEAYDIGGARDLAMCLARPDARQIATLFPPAEGLPGALARARCFDFLAHGMWGVVVWSAGLVIGPDGVPTPFGSECEAALRALRPAERAFAGARILRSPVWILESQASVRAHWMLDSAGDGRTWIRRLSSYERNHSTSLAARESWLRLLEDLGLQARLVPAADLPARLAGGGPRLLILPAQLAVSRGTARAVDAWVARGGVALADHQLGYYDENLVLQPRPVLDAVFGIDRRRPRAANLHVREGRGEKGMRLQSGVAVAESGLTAELGEPTHRSMVQIEHRHGRGETVYLNLVLCEYASLRLDPKRVATAVDLRARVRRVLRLAGVEPPVQLRAPGMPTCIERLVLRAADGRRLLAVRVNALEDPGLMALLGKRGPRAIELVFPRAVAIKDLLTGESYVEARRFELTLDPLGALLLELRNGATEPQGGR